MALAAALVAACGSSPASAPGSATPAASPGVGTPAVVSVGDSYIAGEGGRWAGNIDPFGSLGSGAIDALGASAYFDNADGTAEQISGCHRSASAEIHIERSPSGPAVVSANLACSGATTATEATAGQPFKPGLDAYGDPDGNLATVEPTTSAEVSQAVALRAFARTHNVRLVAVSIGGNDFLFGDTVEKCVEDFVLSSAANPTTCHDDPVADNFDAAHQALREKDIAGALRNVEIAMAAAGYTPAMWTLLAQDYPSPVATSATMRYPQTGLTRQTTGGCGLWDADVDWADGYMLSTVNATVMAAAADVRTAGYPNVVTLDLANLFVGHRLCENTVGTLDEKGLSSWKDARAVDETEWVTPIRAFFSGDNVGAAPYQRQESLHPNYWGELAIRNCLRQAFDAGTPRGGVCVAAGPGLTAAGEPIVRLE